MIDVEPEWEWTTEDEIAFIRSLGRYGAAELDEAARVELLLSYLEGLEARTEWGALSADDVLAAARLELDRAEKRAWYVDGLRRRRDERNGKEPSRAER